MKRLKGQVALITGSGRNMGREIACALAREGADLVVNYRFSEEEAKKTVEETENFGVKAILYKADVSKVTEIEGMVQKTMETFGKIDILINNAGIFMRTPLKDLTEEKWGEVLDTNLKSVLFTTKAVSEGMLQKKRGKILNIAGVGGLRPWPGYLAYCISKAGVIMATKGLAKTLAPDIQVNCIAPGTITVPEELSEERKEKLKDQIPLKRFGSYQDVVNAVLFLLCDTSYVTGQTLVLDGGGVLN